LSPVCNEEILHAPLVIKEPAANLVGDRPIHVAVGGGDGGGVIGLRLVQPTEFLMQFGEVRIRVDMILP
jgi:hypothetical protein